jgi:iron complex outermembrane recepter protein
LSEQKWNLFGGLSYRTQKALSAVDRAFASSSEIPNRGVYYSSFTTFPANYYQPANLPDDTFNPTAPGCDPPNSLPGGNICYFDYVRFIDLIPKQEQLSAIVKGTLAVNNDNTVSLEYVQGNNKLTSVVAPSAIAWSMPSANPFYPGGAGMAGVPGTAGNSTPGFDSNAAIDLDWRTTSMGSRVNTFDNKTDRFLLDWQGAYQNWYYSAAILQSNSNVTNTFNSGYVNENAMRAGLDGSTIPGGNTAAPWLNPFGSQTADGLAYMNSQRILGQVQRAEGKLFGIKGEASGEIYKMPAGPLTMGVGLEYYSNRATYTNNLTLLRQAASSGLEGVEDSSGSRNWFGVFAEFNIPVVKTLDITLAARYDDYSDFGGTFNPKAAIRWAPTKDMLFRGSVNSGFRAASLYEAYSPTSFTNTAGNRLDDPVLCPGGAVDLAAGGVEARDCGQTFQQQQGGNKNLQPETSTAWSVGMVFQPTTSSTVSVDYWNYVVKDSISVIGENAIFANPTANANNFVRCSQLSAAEQTQFDSCRVPGGDPLAYIVNTYLNLGSYKTSGIDFSAGWRSAAYSFGRFSAAWQAPWILDYEYQFEPGGPYYNKLGVYFNGQAIPRYRQFLNLGWQLENWSANLINRYSRGYTDDNSFVAPEYYNTVGATNTWDLAVTWSGIKGLVLTGGLTNMFNQEPPFSNQGTTFQVGYDPRNASPIGRAFLLRGTYSF